MARILKPLPYLWPESAILPTLFMTKVCNFPYPVMTNIGEFPYLIYDLTKNLTPFITLVIKYALPLFQV